MHLKTNITIFFLFIFCVIKAQKDSHLPKPDKMDFKYFINETPWRIELGGNVVDDDGRPFKDLFKTAQSWNIPLYPTRLVVNKSIDTKWSMELALVYNRYNSGKLINGEKINSTYQFFSTDLNIKFDFADFLSFGHIFSPYLVSGLGYTRRSISPYHSLATINTGLGFNVALYRNLGLNVQSIAKFAIKYPFIKTGGNYLQHSLGLVYKINSGSLSKPFKFGRSRYGFATRKNRFRSRK